MTFAHAFGTRSDTELDVGWFPRTQIRHLTGSLKHLRVSNTARYQSTFSPAFPLTADTATVLSYAMEEGSGTQSAGGVSGNSAMTWTNAVWLGASGPSLGICGSLSGTAYGRAAAVSASALTNATLELWYRGSSASGEHQLVMIRPASGLSDSAVGFSIADASAQSFNLLTGRVIHLVVDARRFGGALNARGFAIGASLPTFDETQWHHYAAVFTGSTQRFFVDGTELTTIQQRDGAANTSLASAFDPQELVSMDLGWFPATQIRYASGRYSGIRLSSAARYTSSFLPTYPPATDALTVARWLLNEGSGNQSYDCSANRQVLDWTGVTWGVCQ